MTEIEPGVLYWTESVSPSGVITRSPAEHNLVPYEGLNHMLGVTLKSVTPVPTWYVFLYKGNYTPTMSVTAATMGALMTECTAYTPSTRPEFVEGSIVNGVVDNAASLSEFTFTAAETVYGCGIVAAAAKGSSTGPLLSIVRFASPKVQEIGSVLRVFAGPTASPVL